MHKVQYRLLDMMRSLVEEVRSRYVYQAIYTSDSYCSKPSIEEPHQPKPVRESSACPMFDPLHAAHMIDKAMHVSQEGTPVRIQGD